MAYFVRYAKVVDGSDGVLEIMSEEGEKQLAIENNMACKRRAQHQQPAAPTNHGGESMQRNVTIQRGMEGGGRGGGPRGYGVRYN